MTGAGSEWPEYASYDSAPADIQRLLDLLIPKLLEGEHSMLAIFREQYRQCELRDIALTGAGLYADFDVPAAAPRVVIPDFPAGSAYIELARTPHGAGCVMHVCDGALRTLEIYVYGDKWPQPCHVLEIRDVVPVVPSLWVVPDIGA